MAEGLGGRVTFERELAEAYLLSETDVAGATSRLKKVADGEGKTWEVLLKALADMLSGEEARKYYDRAIQQRANYALAYFARAAALHGPGDEERAESDVRKAVEISPEFWPAWEGLAILMERVGRPDEALSAALEAIRLEPRPRDSYLVLMRVVSHTVVAVPAHADAILDAAVTAVLDHWAPHWARHCVRIKAGKVAEALGDLERARAILASQGGNTAKADQLIELYRMRLQEKE